MKVKVWSTVCRSGLVRLRRKAFLKIGNCCFLAPMGLTISTHTPLPTPFFIQTGN